MRTRAQINAWNEITASNRRKQQAAIASTREGRLEARRSRQSDEENPVAETFVTPTKKRKLVTVTPKQKDQQRAKLNPEQVSVISPTVVAGALSHTGPSVNTKSASIRRTLDYSDTDQDDDKQTPSSPVKKAPLSPQGILESITSGRSSADVQIVGREDERRQIASVFSPTADCVSRALFVIGPPGTGKSSCVASVANEVAVKEAIVRLNCSTFTSPSALFSAIGAALPITKDGLPPLDASHQLANFLSTAKPPTRCALVLDEVDHLIRLPQAQQSRVQRLLRFLIQWTQVSNSNLRFIGILNGLDMHAQITRLLDEMALASCTRPQVVLFPSYTHEQLLAILSGYIHTATDHRASPELVADTIEMRALELIARKVAARDGDARRAVSLLQHSCRAALAASTPTKLTLRDVLQAMNQAMANHSTVLKQIQQLPRQPKLLLYAITRLAPVGHPSSTTVDDVLDELSSLQARPELAWIPRIRQAELQQSIGALDCYALIKQTSASSKTNWKWKLASTVAIDTLLKAFQSDELLRELPAP